MLSLEVTAQGFKVFTKGIDSSQLQLLCRSSDSSIPLEDIQWTSTSFSIQNPFIVSTLSNGYYQLLCNRVGDASFNYSIVVQGIYNHVKQNTTVELR